MQNRHRIYRYNSKARYDNRYAQIGYESGEVERSKSDELNTRELR